MFKRTEIERKLHTNAERIKLMSKRRQKTGFHTGWKICLIPSQAQFSNLHTGKLQLV